MHCYRPDMSARRLFRGLLVLLALLPGMAAAAPAQVEVRDPFLDLYTGPGRGYPITHSIGRGAAIEIQHRHTDWYRIRSAQADGCVHRRQLRATLAAAGAGRDTRSAILDRHIEGRLRAGVSVGVFEDDPVIAFWGSVRLDPTWTLALSLGQAAGDFSSTRMLRLEGVAQPWPEQRFPVHLLLGIGRFENVPRQTLVESTEEDAFAFSAGAGISTQLEQRLGLRADWRWHHARFDGGSDNYHEFTAGFVLLF